MADYRFLSRSSDGGIVLACCHPSGCPTWHWSISLNRKRQPGQSLICRQTGVQSHTFVALPFRWQLILSRQTYHLRAPQ